MQAPQGGARPPKSLRELFFGFAAIGARSFGGVLPWAHRVMVEERRWLAPTEFGEVIALCQFLPGPNVGNAAVVLGRRWFGAAGAAVAFAGLVAPPLLWVLALVALYADWASHPAVRAAVTGVGVAGGGLFIGTALKLAAPIARRPAGVAIAVGCFAAVALGRVSLFVVLPIATALAWLAARAGRL